jgi:hypothetical protein
VSRANEFEQAARERKCLRMLAALPATASTAESQSLADCLAKFTIADRARWATNAGCNPPSESTWTRFVELARRREPARRDPFSRVS